MPDQVLFSKPYGTVLVDDSVPCIISQWHAFANADEFMTLLLVGVEYFEQHSTPAKPWGWVGDVRQMSAIPAKAQAWLISEFNRRISAAGLREMSIVVAENVFGQLAAQQYADNTQRVREPYELRTTFYNSLGSAKAGAGAVAAGR